MPRKLGEAHIDGPVTSSWGAIFLETTGPKKQGSQPQKGFSSLNTFLIDLDWPNQANDCKSLIFNDIFSDMDASQMQVGCKGVPGARFRWFDLQSWLRHFT